MLTQALLLARIAIHAGAHDDAVKLLRKIVTLAPRFIVAWHDLGATLNEQGKEEEALCCPSRGPYS